jgi:hypothetical protein
MASCAHAPHPKFQDSDLRRLMAWFPGAYDLRALSWAHVRVWGAAGSYHSSPQRSISRVKHDLHSRNAQSAHSPAKPACGSRAQRLPRRAHVPRTGRAGHTRLGTRLSVGGGRCPEIQGVARVRTMPSEQEECMRDSSLWQRAHMILCSDTATGRMQATRSCHTRLCRRHRQPGSSNRKARSTLQRRCALVLTRTWMHMSPNATDPGYRRFRRPRSPAARNGTGHLPCVNHAGYRRAPSTICTRMGRANRRGRLDGANL